jgi:hypothetical protein
MAFFCENYHLRLAKGSFSIQCDSAPPWAQAVGTTMPMETEGDRQIRSQLSDSEDGLAIVLSGENGRRDVRYGTPGADGLLHVAVSIEGEHLPVPIAWQMIYRRPEASTP